MYLPIHNNVYYSILVIAMFFIISTLPQSPSESESNWEDKYYKLKAEKLELELENRDLKSKLSNSQQTYGGKMTESDGAFRVEENMKNSKQYRLFQAACTKIMTREGQGVIFFPCVRARCPGNNTSNTQKWSSYLGHCNGTNSSATDACEYARYILCEEIMNQGMTAEDYAQQNPIVMKINHNFLELYFESYDSDAKLLLEHVTDKPRSIEFTMFLISLNTFERLKRKGMIIVVNYRGTVMLHLNTKTLPKDYKRITGKGGEVGTIIQKILVPPLIGDEKKQNASKVRDTKSIATPAIRKVSNIGAVTQKPLVSPIVASSKNQTA